MLGDTSFRIFISRHFTMQTSTIINDNEENKHTSAENLENNASKTNTTEDALF